MIDYFSKASFSSRNKAIFRGIPVVATLRGLRLAYQQLRRTAELFRAGSKFRLGEAYEFHLMNFPRKKRLFLFCHRDCDLSQKAISSQNKTSISSRSNPAMLRIWSRQIFQRLRGESLIEIMVAIVILTTVLSSAFTVISRGLNFSEGIRERVMALNLAREGLEAVHHLRASNWLRFSGNRANKWLCLESPCDAGKNAATESSPSHYRLNYDSVSETYTLELSAPDMSGTDTAFAEFDPANPDERLQLWKHSSDSAIWRPQDLTGTPLAYPTDWERTPFFRQISLEVGSPFFDTNVSSFCPGTNNSSTCDQARVTVTVRVYWENANGDWQSTTQQGHLFNFYERSSYD